MVLTLVCMTLCVIYLQVLCHEMAHALPLSFSYKWRLKVHPFPSKVFGQFTLCAVSCAPTSNCIFPKNNELGMVSILPIIMNVVLSLFFGTLTFMLPISFITLFFGMFAVSNLYDYIFHMFEIFFKEHIQSDIWRFCKYKNIKPKRIKLISAITVPMFVVAMTFIIGHFIIK
jgi:hypothetical protein